MDVSIVSPVYNELENVERLCETVHGVMSTLGKTYEVVLVDDGSTDGTTELLKETAAKYPHFVVVTFRRN